MRKVNDMEKGYFAAAWGDVTKSPGWFSKFLRLGLLLCVPVFGIMVLYGYLYSWARDIAWNVHRPLPDKIFGNEDGNLYKRGFFILVIAFVFSLIPEIFSVVTNSLSGVSFGGAMYHNHLTAGMGALFVGFMLWAVSMVLYFVVSFFVWVGSMRTALYGTLSAGFQLSKIWSMMRYDFMGLLRIFAMNLICGVIAAIGFTILGIVLALMIGAFAGLFIAVGGDSTPALILPFVLAIIIVILAFIVVCCVCCVFIEALLARALGYWTRQFQVNLWGGQEDPMPFEREQAQRTAQAQQYYQQQNYAQPGYQNGYQQQVPQQQPGQQPASQQPNQQPSGQQPMTQQPVSGQPTATQQQQPMGVPVAYQQQPASQQQPAAQPVGQSGQQPAAQPVVQSGQQPAAQPADQPSQQQESKVAAQSQAIPMPAVQPQAQIAPNQQTQAQEAQAQAAPQEAQPQAEATAPSEAQKDPAFDDSSKDDKEAGDTDAPADVKSDDTLDNAKKSE